MAFQIALMSIEQCYKNTTTQYLSLSVKGSSSRCRGSKEMVEEKKGGRVVEDQRVVKEVEGDSQLEV